MVITKFGLETCLGWVLNNFGQPGYLKAHSMTESLFPGNSRKAEVEDLLWSKLNEAERIFVVSVLDHVTQVGEDGMEIEEKDRQELHDLFYKTCNLGTWNI